MKQGATTMWEDWEGSEFASLNHYAQGAVCQWLFESVAAGIRVDGENRFTIAPVPGGTLTHAKASYHSIYGEIYSRWEKTGEGLCFHVTIPANTTAEIRLPDGTLHSIKAGSHSFTV